MGDMAKVKRCPSCGSAKIETSVEQRSVNVPLAPAATYKASIDRCLDCETIGDFDRSNSTRIAEAVHESKKEGLVAIIHGLNEMGGYSMASMERALGLSQRTMMRWKSGHFSDSTVALLRLVAVYPWLIDVADAKFDLAYAQERLATEGFRAAARIAEAQHIPACFVSHTDPFSQRVTGIFTAPRTEFYTTKNSELSEALT